MYSHNIYCHDLMIVDGDGHDVMSVGSDGFYSGDTNTLNIDEGFEAPAGGDVDYYGENDFESEITEAGLDSGGYEGFGADGDMSSSFDFGGDSDAGDAGDGGSSCSSCSSCGGCGGGD